MKRTEKIDPIILVLFAILFIIPLAGSSAAQTTAFNYQGRLSDNGNPANGSYDMQFKLFDTATVGTGTQQGSTLTNPTAQVTNGSFAVNLDFGSNVFTGDARFLEISVRPAGSLNPYTVLAPRQPITSSPYAIQTINAQQFGGLPPSRFVQFDALGNVGIGSITPNTRLSLSGGPIWTSNGWTASMNMLNGSAFGWEANGSGQRFGIGQSGGGLYFFRTNSAFGNTASPPNYDLLINDEGRVGIGTPSPEAKLHVAGDGITGVYSNSTSAYGVYGNSTNSIGVVGQSTFAFGVYGNSTNSFGVFGQSTNNYAGYFQGNVHVIGTVTQGSDARLKQGISKLAYGLSEVLRLRPVSWRWKDHPERGPQLGLVAQEVEAVLPELVSTSKDGEQTKGLNYVGLLPVLVNAIKEQQQQLDQQQARDRQQQTQLAEIATLQQQLRQVKQQKEVILQQQREMAAIKRLLCASRPRAAICQAEALK